MWYSLPLLVLSVFKVYIATRSGFLAGAGLGPFQGNSFYTRVLFVCNLQ